MALKLDDYLPAGPSPTARDPCGLFVTAEAANAVPLKKRTVVSNVLVRQGVSDTTETFEYISDFDATVQFIFPLPPRSSVYKFNAIIGDRTIVTEVKRNAEAEEEYKLAVQQGHSGVLMTQAPGASLFNVELGNLAALEECTITFSYVRLLDRVATSLEYTHQATWVPPYVTTQELAAGPDKMAESNPKFADKVFYTLSYKIVLISDTQISSIESLLPIMVVDEGTNKIVTLSESVSDPSRDFTLLVELPSSIQQSSQLVLQECQRQGRSKVVALATFVLRPPEKPPSGPATGLKQELWFVVDCSGSMQGAPEVQAREAALFFVRDLPTGQTIRFNVVVFGSQHVKMWPQPRLYDATSEKEAVDWVQQRVRANMGGTEIVSCLQDIYKTPLEPGYARQIIFLTDGGVSSNEENVIYNIVGGSSFSPSPTTCVFTLGIGHGVHRGLVEGMAKKSNGVAAFVVDDEPLATKCGYLKKCALADPGSCWLKPRLLARSATIRAVPHVLPQRLLPGEPVQVLAEVLQQEAGAALELVAQLQDGSQVSQCLPLAGAQQQPGEALAVLHAMCYIGSLLEGRSPLHVDQEGTELQPAPSQSVVEDAVVRMAIAENLVTPRTAAVGVLLQQNPLDSKDVKRLDVPLQVPLGRMLFKTPALPQAFPGRVRCMHMAPAAALPPVAFGFAPTDPAAAFSQGFFSRVMKKHSLAPDRILSRGATSECNEAARPKGAQPFGATAGFGAASVFGPPPTAAAAAVAPVPFGLGSFGGPAAAPVPFGFGASSGAAAITVPFGAPAGLGAPGVPQDVFAAGPAAPPGPSNYLHAPGGSSPMFSAKTAAWQPTTGDDQAKDLSAAIDMMQVDNEPSISIPAADRGSPQDVLRCLNLCRSTEGTFPWAAKPLDILFTDQASLASL